MLKRWDRGAMFLHNWDNDIGRGPIPGTRMGLLEVLEGGWCSDFQILINR